MTNEIEQNNDFKLQKNKKYMLVRYGRMQHFGVFEHNESSIPKLNKRVVIKTEKGLEMGDIIGNLTLYRGGQLKLDAADLDEYFKVSEIDYESKICGKLMRFATHDDISEEKHLVKISKEELDYCRQLTSEMNLPMKIVDSEHIFGGERIIFYFMSETRVDFRDLVKRLAHEYQTRIEMRQIGSRDEAKLFGDCESCGQTCCCIAFLKALKPVNMRMAKMQKATLDPAKISGYCGRLKCCLRYEDQTYTELKRKLPPRGTIVKTPNGNGKIVDGQIITQLISVEHSETDRRVYRLDDVDIVSLPQFRQRDEEEFDEKASKEARRQKKEFDENPDNIKKANEQKKTDEDLEGDICPGR